VIGAVAALFLAASACGDEATSGDADGGATCDESRALEYRPVPTSPMVQIERGGHAHDVALPRPQSALLPRLSPPARSARLPAEAGAPRAIGLRFLVVTPDAETPSYSAALAAFQRIGVPHEVLVARDHELTEDLLYQPDGSCRFAGIVLADGTLAYDDGAQWVSAFSADEWDRLAAYEVACDAREAVWYGYPDSESTLRRTSMPG
jgi:hypothetical protein